MGSPVAFHQAVQNHVEPAAWKLFERSSGQQGKESDGRTEEDEKEEGGILISTHEFLHDVMMAAAVVLAGRTNLQKNRAHDGWASAALLPRAW